MKIIFTLLFALSNSFCFSQTGKINIDVIITDTIKPYFLNIYAYKSKKLVSEITIAENGNYTMKDLEEGNYTFEFQSFESRSRQLYLDNINVTRDSVKTLKVIYPGPCRFSYSKNYKPVCPYNHSDNIVRIVYGFPNNKMMEKAKKGLIHLGGCTITDCDPQYYCTVHKKEI